MRLRITNRDGVESHGLDRRALGHGEAEKDAADHRRARHAGWPERPRDGHGLSRRAPMRRSGSPAPADHQTLATTTTQAGGDVHVSEEDSRSRSPPARTWKSSPVTRDSKPARSFPSRSSPISPSAFGRWPPRWRGSKEHTLSLDGAWRINPDPDSGESGRSRWTRRSWGDFHVPGQWAQQGYDIPQDKTVALARQFTDSRRSGPATGSSCASTPSTAAPTIGSTASRWAIARTCSRRSSGRSPTRRVRARRNRLDLAMIVATKSEELSNSCLLYQLHARRHRPLGADLRSAQAAHCQPARECRPGPDLSRWRVADRSRTG